VLLLLFRLGIELSVGLLLLLLLFELTGGYRIKHGVSESVKALGVDGLIDGTSNDALGTRSVPAAKIES
jgi:hypothetical protein